MRCRAYLPFLLMLVSCLGAKKEDLFETSASAGANPPSDARAGTGSVKESGGSSSGGSTAQTGGTSTDVPSSGGSAGNSSGGTGGTTQAGGTAGAADVPKPESCDAIERSTTNSDNGHCYRVNAENLTFKAAADACRAAGAHLATIGDAAENHFVQHLQEAEHWLGATDGRADDEPGAGTYSWIDGEKWSYTNWEGGQPNAVATDCPGQSGGAHCYEHCLYEKSTGGWIDRACWHTIASVCEWDIDPKPGAGDSGPGGAAPMTP